METRAGGTGEGLEAPPLEPPPLEPPPLKPPLVKAPLVRPWLPLEMRLHIHARLGASENNEIRHRCRMTAHRISSLI